MHAKLPLVSVILPTFNRPQQTLLRAVSSVLKQTVHDIECIVIDDGSAEHAMQTLATVKDDRLKVLRHATNQGASSARNTGVRAASGDWIAYIDSDDEWLPTKLAQQLNDLNDSHTCISYCKATVAQPDGSLKERPHKPWTEEPLLQYLIADGGFIQTSGLVHHKSQNLDFDQQTFPFDDWDWLLRQTKKGLALRFLPVVLYRYHQDADKRAPSYSGRPLSEQATYFISKHTGEFAKSTTSLEQLRYGCVSHAISTKNPLHAIWLLYTIARDNYFSIDRKFLRFLLRALTPATVLKIRSRLLNNRH